ncbi:MAG: Na(+)-translocating NADH-quinone reductase subunit C [Planctomycetales bacterium]|nr:Na(+)-translocating NADH-quinone reductase subunit C [Planctomycetales bacterium]
MLPKDSITNTFIVSLALCIVCSLLVSSAAVSLKGRQDENKVVDRQRNIIAAAGLSDAPKDLSISEVKEIFEKQVEQRLVDLDTGEYVEEADSKFDPRKAAKDPSLNEEIEGAYSIGLKNREKQTWVYLIKDGSGNLEKVVLPIYGKGLWSTMYGFIALNGDLRTVGGITFYEHGETPGLGGEIENPQWQGKWAGKQIWEIAQQRDDKNLRVGVTKGAPTESDADYKVDGLSGATITSRGVDSLLKYWFSSNGFGNYLNKLASQQGANNGSPNG